MWMERVRLCWVDGGGLGCFDGVYMILLRPVCVPGRHPGGITACTRMLELGSKFSTVGRATVEDLRCVPIRYE